MNDWTLRPLAKSSDLSGRPFAPGDAIVCFLFRNLNQELQRHDVHGDEAETYTPTGYLVCRWNRTVRERIDDEAEARKHTLATAEEIFVSLYDTDVADGPIDPDKDALKHLLALMLERKRLLRPAPGRPGIMVLGKDKREFLVPAVELTPHRLISLQEQLQALFL